MERLCCCTNHTCVRQWRKGGREVKTIAIGVQYNNYQQVHSSLSCLKVVTFFNHIPNTVQWTCCVNSTVNMLCQQYSEHVVSTVQWTCCVNSTVNMLCQQYSEHVVSIVQWTCFVNSTVNMLCQHQSEHVVSTLQWTCCVNTTVNMLCQHYSEHVVSSSYKTLIKEADKVSENSLHSVRT
jgi:hypothetical protein